MRENDDCDLPFEPKKIEIFTHNGSKFVRRKISLSSYEQSLYYNKPLNLQELSDGRTVYDKEIAWFLVEHIKWLPTNGVLEKENGILIAKKAITAGIRFTDLKDFLEIFQKEIIQNTVPKDLFQIENVISVINDLINSPVDEENLLEDLMQRKTIISELLERYNNRISPEFYTYLLGELKNLEEKVVKRARTY